MTRCRWALEHLPAPRTSCRYRTIVNYKWKPPQQKHNTFFFFFFLAFFHIFYTAHPNRITCVGEVEFSVPREDQQRLILRHLSFSLLTKRLQTSTLTQSPDPYDTWTLNTSRGPFQPHQRTVHTDSIPVGVPAPLWNKWNVYLLHWELPHFSCF